MLFLTKSTAKTIHKIQLRRLGAGTLDRRPGAAQGPEPDLGRRRPRHRPADGRRRRGDARGPRRPPGRGRGLRPGRAGRPLPDRGPEGPQAVPGSVPQAPDRPRPGNPPGRRLVARPDRRPLDGPAADRGPHETPTKASSPRPGRGSQLLSRKIDGFGPPSSATPEQKEAGDREVASLVRRRPAARRRPPTKVRPTDSKPKAATDAPEGRHEPMPIMARRVRARRRPGSTASRPTTA